MTTVINELDQPYAVDPEQVRSYARDGYVKLRRVLSRQVVDRYQPAFSDLVISRMKSVPGAMASTSRKIVLRGKRAWRRSCSRPAWPPESLRR